MTARRGFLHRNAGRIALAAGIATVLAAFYAFGLERYLGLDYLRGRLAWLRGLYAAYPPASVCGYLALYVAVTGLSLPLAIPITLVGGAVFGLALGSALVTLTAALGALLAFLAARYLFRDAVQRRFAAQLARVNRGIERDGAYYLFLMRLIPAFPFFVINLAMGVTPMRARTYFLVSLVGMIPGNVLYVNAGVQLARVHSLSGLFSPVLIASLAALGVFPLAVKKGVDLWRARRAG